MLALARLTARVFIDVGPDRVLAGLTSRNLPDAGSYGLEELGVLA
jgi:malonyl CoA-acyl carrier protein transacylase